MTQRFFITATGTDQGKTLVTAALCWQLRQQAKAVTALKPVVSGMPEDTENILRALEKPVTQETIDAVSPWRFMAALSPDAAAAREGRRVDVDAVADYCLQAHHEGITLIEGAGGVMSPLNEAETNLDLIVALQCRAILVSTSFLGCISQLLTAVEVLRYHHVGIAGIVLSQTRPEAPAVESVLPSLRPHLLPGIVTIGVNHLASGGEIWKTVPDLTSLVSLK